jgi:hypothetical protein
MSRCRLRRSERTTVRAIPGTQWPDSSRTVRPHWATDRPRSFNSRRDFDKASTEVRGLHRYPKQVHSRRFFNLKTKQKQGVSEVQGVSVVRFRPRPPEEPAA